MKYKTIVRIYTHSRITSNGSMTKTKRFQFNYTGVNFLSKLIPTPAAQYKTDLRDYLQTVSEHIACAFRPLDPTL